LKAEKTYNVSKATTKKQVGSSVPEVGIATIVINNGSYPSIDWEEYNKKCVVGWRF
jgi:hypothetical protein